MIVPKSALHFRSHPSIALPYHNYTYCIVRFTPPEFHDNLELHNPSQSRIPSTPFKGHDSRNPSGKQAFPKSSRWDEDLHALVGVRGRSFCSGFFSFIFSVHELTRACGGGTTPSVMGGLQQGPGTGAGPSAAGALSAGSSGGSGAGAGTGGGGAGMGEGPPTTPVLSTIERLRQQRQQRAKAAAS